MNGYLDVLDVLTRLLQEVERWMSENLEEDAVVRLLTTIPGVGLILAHVIRAEIGEIERFPTLRHLASYAGLAPMSNDTAGREGPRHCSAACNHVLRWAFVEAVHGVQKTKGQRGFRLRRLYARLCSQGPHKGRKSSAKVAVAHGWFTWCGPNKPRIRIRRRHGQAAVKADNKRRNLKLRKQHCARTSPVTLWSAAGQPSARPACNWAVRCRIPILCRVGCHKTDHRKLSVMGGCSNT
jgi:hypothetical protein